MHRLRLPITFTLLTLWLIATFLYVLSWTNPQCLAAWHHEDSYMLATSNGKIYCLYEFSDSESTPYLQWWTFRWFAGNDRVQSYRYYPKSSGTGQGFFSPYTPDPDPITHKRDWLTLDVLPGTFKFNQLGFVFSHHSPLSPSAGRFAESYPNHLVAIVPLWALWLPLTLITFIVYRKTRTMLHRRKLNLCIACAYDLRASPDRCPECGLAVAPKSPPPLTASRQWTRHHPILTGLITFAACALLFFLLKPARPPVLYINPQPIFAATAPAILGKPVSLNFENAPLGRVIAALSEQSGCPILTEWDNLSIKEDSPVTARTSGTMPLLTALKFVLDKAGLQNGYLVDAHGVVHITDPERISNIRSVSKTYDIHDILQVWPTDPLDVRRDRSDFNKAFEDSIMDNVDPESWPQVGGSDSSLERTNGMLTIYATYETHTKVAAFLYNARLHFGLNPPAP